MELIGNNIGLIHLVASCFALVFGAIVLVAEKATKFHKQMGYCYFVSMLLTLTTAMFIYRLFGGFGPFHVIAIIGFLYLIVGIVPILLKTKNWLKIHIYFMYWSVLGLYAAFAAEILVRIPTAPFWTMVGIAVAAISIIGGIGYNKYKESWQSVLMK